MARKRVSGGFSLSSSCIQKVYNPKGEYLSTYKWNDGGPIGQQSTIIDVVTPGYRRRRSHGELIMNPVSLTRETAMHTSGGRIQVGRHSDSWGTVTIEGDIGYAVERALGAAVTMYSDADRHRNIALIKAYAEMNRSPILSGEIMHDLNQTLSMLRRPFGGSISLLSRIAKKRNSLLRKGYNFTKACSDAWLEYRYGWRPLVADGIEIMHQSRKLRKKLDKRIHVARGGSSGNRSLTNEITASLFSGNYTAKGTMVRTEKVRSSAGVFFSFLPQNEDEKVAQALGLNARNLPATVWEVIPYSFVADWFVNVGDWLEAITPRSDIIIRGSWATSVVETSLHLSGGEISRTLPNPTKTYTGWWNPVDNSTMSYTRSVNPVLPSTPVLKVNPLSTNQTVDALSLTVGKINRFLKDLRH